LINGTQKSKPWVVIGAAFLVLPLVVIAARAWMMSRLPIDALHVASYGQEQEPEIPPRPGILGIEISGPEIKAKRFEIDLSRSGQISIGWQKLLTVDPNAQIIVNAAVDNQGQLTISQREVRMEGHPQAGVMIIRAMKTWMYTPYKTGPIQFTFNLPSEGRKLLINASGLKRKSDIPPEVPIFDGLSYWIDGIPPQEVQVVGSYE